jgi:hypothetical protein
MKKIFLFTVLAGICSLANAQQLGSKFEQLGNFLPTPNTYRAADGSPGHEYWQQKADYKIKASLDDAKQSIKGSETITYYNNSPNELNYLWLQLDQNLFDKNSDTYKTRTFNIEEERAIFGFLGWVAGVSSDGGYQVANVKDDKGNNLKVTFNRTMMRIDLLQPLKANGCKFTFSLDWTFKVIDAEKMGARGGYEYFSKDGNYIYEIAQWFPRMCVYSDVYGWQHKQFLGQGEFALAFGDYEVALTVPADHILGATGELQNAKEVLTATQQQRWEQAKTATNPILIVTMDEAKQAESKKLTTTKTWVFKAKNVRDFAFATSRKFIWDAMQVNVGGKNVWAMSYYPKEGNPLWGEKSTQSVAHTLRVYSRYTFDYPYPVAISVHGPIFGMEYPMICFNGGRPNEDGTVPDRTKYSMISVIIHEVGHNFFPMIVNSDERQWSWMDEGLNSFMQYLAEVEIPGQAWAKEIASPYPGIRRGPAKNIVNYMKADPKSLEPIMTNSEQIRQFGNNAYGKPATALNILRETVLGKELFDYSFKQYAQKWKFKHPEPADFFRTMEDASGTDLDWFWRSWFFTTDFYDANIDNVTLFTVLKNGKKVEDVVAKFPVKEFTSLQKAMADAEKNGIILNETEKNMVSDKNFFYSVKFKNNGEMPMPLIVELTFADGTKQVDKIPAEIWRINHKEITKLFVTQKEVVSFQLDPALETADTDVTNNMFPKTAPATDFDKMKQDKK